MRRRESQDIINKNANEERLQDAHKLIALDMTNEIHAEA